MIEPVAVEPREFRNTLGRFATGVTVITSVDNGVVHGMTASAFMSVSLEPPLVAVSVDQRARTHRLLEIVEQFGVSVLAESQEPYSRFFAGARIAGLEPDYFWHENTPLLTEALAHLVCRVVAAYPGGDHTIYVGRVQHLAYNRLARPLLYYRGRYTALVDRP